MRTVQRILKDNSPVHPAAVSWDYRAASFLIYGMCWWGWIKRLTACLHESFRSISETTFLLQWVATAGMFSRPLQVNDCLQTTPEHSNRSVSVYRAIHTVDHNKSTHTHITAGMEVMNYIYSCYCTCNLTLFKHTHDVAWLTGACWVRLNTKY